MIIYTHTHTPESTPTGSPRASLSLRLGPPVALHPTISLIHAYVTRKGQKNQRVTRLEVRKRLAREKARKNLILFHMEHRLQSAPTMSEYNLYLPLALVLVGAFLAYVRWTWKRATR